VVGKIEPGGKRVAFEPFVGVAPRRYVEFFAWNRRKDNRNGKLLKWDPQTARLRFGDEDAPELRQHQPAYRMREYLVMHLLRRVQLESGLAVRGIEGLPATRQSLSPTAAKSRTPGEAIKSTGNRKRTPNKMPI
jgi:hypothetical protein